jgi:RNA polymerase sigma-70 factor (ECF subfamily)
LQSYFALPAGTELPQRLAYLVKRFDAAVETPKTRPDDVFRDALIAALPALRGFAFSLVGDPSRADDLVQEALAKAWANRHRFTPGTNMNAWLFTILRNQFYSDKRKARREVEDADGTYAAALVALPEQEGVVNLKGLQDRLARIPEAQRIALMMVGAEGYTYEEAAEVLECKIGTVKSRVSRARAYLSDILGLGDAAAADALT